MKHNNKVLVCVLAVLALLATCCAVAETTETPAIDPYIASVSPAISVYEKCADSIVGVLTYTETWSRQTGNTEKTEIGEGSGIVIAEDGYILTNNHVVEDGNFFEVMVPSGEKVEATLIGTDSGTDLAVLQVKDQDLEPIEIGSSAGLHVGETVIAIGNPGGTVLANTVTQGIVSALERDMEDTFTRSVLTIQHDAAINPGNSGGALLNVYGQLVGINTLKMTGSAYSSTTYEGLGFAIPVDLALPLAQQIMEFGEVRRPALGVTCGTFSGPDEPMSNYPPASVVIIDVTIDGPADEAGIKPLDFITEVDGKRVSSLQDLTAILDTHAEGDVVKVKALRYSNTNYILQLLAQLGYNVNTQSANGNSYGYGYGFGYGFGGSYGYSSRLTYEELEFDVTLKIITND